MLRRVGDDAARPVALHTRDDVVRFARDALGDDTEAVVLHGGGAADTAQETLLDTLVELDDSNTRGGLKSEESVRFKMRS